MHSHNHGKMRKEIYQVTPRKIILNNKKKNGKKTTDLLRGDFVIISSSQNRIYISCDDGAIIFCNTGLLTVGSYRNIFLASSIQTPSRNI